MTADEVAILGRDFAIGGHTHTHPILAELSAEAASENITRNLRELEQVCGSPPAAFAYPNGRPGRDFTERDSRIVENTGYRLAVSTEWSLASPASSRFALPRVSFSEQTETGFLLRLLKLYVRTRLG